MTRIAVACVTMLTSLLALLGVAAPAAAQDGINLAISAHICERDPGRIDIGEALPADCAAAAGVAFTVTTEDSTAVGSCVTDETGFCFIEVPLGTTIVVTEDVSTLPAGYTPRENPLTAQTPAPPGPSSDDFFAKFINLPAGGGGAPTLPDTGVGTAATASAEPGWPAVVAALVVAGGLGYGLRQRVVR